jgi:arsenate reductase
VNRVAVITDIHGNLPALEASLEAIDALGVDTVYCGGDLVGYGPHPNEVCGLIEERAIPTIYGNYDYAIGRDLEDRGCAYVTQHDRELGQRSVDWTLAHTDQRSKDFMRGLPALFELAANGRHLARSAGTTPAERVYPEVLEVMRGLGIDLSDRTPQLLTRELTEWADIVVTMGCGDRCPYVPGKRYIDWELPDPAGRPIDEVRSTRDEINRRVQDLITELDSTATKTKEHA